MMGRVFDVQRFSVHDGPGIRTTVFLKGCPLNCAWCHNPEGISTKPHLSFGRDECVCCGECARACPKGAHSVSTDGEKKAHLLDRGPCDACGECVSACGAGCLEMVGRSLAVADVMREVLADRAFYRRGSGGLTISGGEPLMQPEFAVALLAAAKREGLHCCVETSGFGSMESLFRMLSLTDLFLFDWKLTDAVEHERHTGQSNSVILRNLRELYGRGARIRLQCPLIPGVNDNESHYKGIEALAESMPDLDGVSILPYHALGTSKLRRFGWSACSTISSTSAIHETASMLADRLVKRGVRVVGGGAHQRGTGIPQAAARIQFRSAQQP